MLSFWVSVRSNYHNTVGCHIIVLKDLVLCGVVGVSLYPGLNRAFRSVTRPEMVILDMFYPCRYKFF